jgi:hypothetical protein
MQQWKIKGGILAACLFACALFAAAHSKSGTYPQIIPFYGDTLHIELPITQSCQPPNNLSENAISQFIEELDNLNWQATIENLERFRNEKRLDDWLYYQVIRKVAQEVFPKQANYYAYTIAKWHLLDELGYAAAISFGEEQLLLYVHTKESIFNLPVHNYNNKQYVCLNLHDYQFNYQQIGGKSRSIYSNEEGKSFSYQISSLPVLASTTTTKQVRFQEVHFEFQLNESVQQIFKNYPTVDYALHFNMPMSAATYGSLIPTIQQQLKGKSQHAAIEWLMQFTRYAFLYEPDHSYFGRETRLSPEQTLFSPASDCEDRSALFYFLVKELFNLPMIVLEYHDHLTIAVALEKGKGKPIVYQGKKYYVCEPTPQEKDLRIGELPQKYRSAPFDIVLAYQPHQ